MIELIGICQEILFEWAQKMQAEGYEHHGNWKEEALSSELQQEAQAYHSQGPAASL